jgi:hypothetical protein
VTAVGHRRSKERRVTKNAAIGAALGASRPVRLGAAVGLAFLAAACGGGSQGSPEAVVRAVYERLGQGEFEQVCELVLPSLVAQYERMGGTCQLAVSQQYDEEDRASFVDVQVDPDLIEVNGDTATVPESAVTFAGEPSSDGSTDLVRQDGKWWIAS